MHDNDIYALTYPLWVEKPHRNQETEVILDAFNVKSGAAHVLEKLPTCAKRTHTFPGSVLSLTAPPAHFASSTSTRIPRWKRTCTILNDVARVWKVQIWRVMWGQVLVRKPMWDWRRCTIASCLHFRPWDLDHKSPDVAILLFTMKDSMTSLCSLYQFVTEQFQEENLDQEIRGFVEQHAMSWTDFCGTIQHFVNHFEANDAEVFQIDLINLRDTFNKLIDPAHWRFLESQEGHRKRPTTMSEHEQRCAEIEAHIRQSGVAKCPRMVGRHRVLLHAYTGRRRVGDVQYFMEQFAALRPDYVIHVVSLDIIVDTQWGDASNPATREYWIEAIKAGYVLAFVGGPPCETWSRASPWWVTEAGPQDHPGCGTSLGVRRDHFTWSSSTHHG